MTTKRKGLLGILYGVMFSDLGYWAVVSDFDTKWSILIPVLW